MRAPRVLEKAEWPPNYVAVWAWRQTHLLRMKDDPKLMYGCFEYYRDKPIEFICHWVDTVDPRNAMTETPTFLPFVLFKRQAEMIEFVMTCLKEQRGGLIDKSRATGATWLGVALSIWLWIYYPGASIGWGSATRDKVDILGNPDTVFEKLRLAIRRLPRFFWPRGFNPDDHMLYMRIINPENGATITGEIGDNIGRGGRKLVYFKDESSHYERPELVEASLMSTTFVPIDISTCAGVGTVFDRKREAGTIWEVGDPLPPRSELMVFVLDWSDHPAQTKQWHDDLEQQTRASGMLAKFRQEVDRDPTASVEGIICPQEWVRAAVDAHKKLELGEDGRWVAAFDVADEGGDLNALAMRKGIVLKSIEDWGEGDTGKNTRRVAGTVRSKAPIDVQYDSCGIGAGVKSEANRLRDDGGLPLRGVNFVAWNAGAAVLNPDALVVPGVTNKDFYGNMKAQGWWALRLRFERTFYALTVKGFKFKPDELISLDGSMPNLRRLMRELSQPVSVKDGKLRLIVDKKPEGAKSPNMADAVMMCYFPLSSRMLISEKAMGWAEGNSSLPSVFSKQQGKR